MSRAKSNLILAAAVLEGVNPADHCFDTQQAAEKSIKAVFVRRGIEYPYTHDIAKLLRLLDKRA